MAHSDFSTFSSRAQWQQELDTLVAAAELACQPSGTAASRQLARTDLRDFRAYPCPFDALRSRALEALNDLSLADIGHAIGHLQHVQQQLLSDQTDLQASRRADQHQPMQQARRALTALAAVADQHPAVAQAVRQLDEALRQVE